jgi:hypothetical protein
LRAGGLQQRLDELEARKIELGAKLAAPAPSSVRLHPNLAQLYRERVAELHIALADPELRSEALELIRGQKVAPRPLRSSVSSSIASSCDRMKRAALTPFSTATWQRC